MSDIRYLYVMQCKEYVKFGISKNPNSRIKELQTGNPYKINLLLKINYSDCFDIENNVHSYFDKKRGLGEWFLIDKEIKNFVKYLKNTEYESNKRSS